MKKLSLIATIAFCIFISCNKKETPDPLPAANEFIRGADLSFLPEIEQAGTIFFDQNNSAKNALDIFKANGCNAVRIRLWHTPSNVHSSLAEVKTFAERIAAAGLKVWLDIHYSDTWADPGAQTKPAAWQSASFENLKDSVYNYTRKVVQFIHPDYVQIGNEINDGFLWPEGRISVDPDKFLSLLKAGCKAARDAGTNSKIMIHYAGINASDWYALLRNKAVDYDLIGLSYYPVYHGFNLADVNTAITNLGAENHKPVIIAETAYPFTLGYNDYTNNTVGLLSQTIPAYPPSPAGQKAYLLALRNVVQTNTSGAGICYWAPDWVAFRGPTATNGSAAENQALFDFNNKVLEGISLFNR